MGVECVIGALMPLLLVFGIMYRLMLGKLGKRFMEEAHIASQIWAGARPVPGAG
jgi:hypothetical protein